MSEVVRRSALRRATRSTILYTAAVATAGAVALAPVSPPVAHAAATVPVSSTSYALTASYNPIDAWQSVFSNAGANLNGLANSLGQGPFTLGQAIAANQLDHLAMLPDVLGIASSMWTNLSAGVSAPFARDDSNLTFAQILVLNTVLNTTGVTDPPLQDWQKSLLEFTTTSTTGLLLGLAGPALGPVVSLADNLGKSVGEISSGELTKALETVIDIPANMTGAFLNGGPSLPLNPLLSLLGINLAGSLASTKTNLVLGGVLSQGTSLWQGITFSPPFVITGTPPGALASAMHLSQEISEAIRPGSTTLSAPTGSALIRSKTPSTSTSLNIGQVQQNAKALLKDPLGAVSDSSGLGALNKPLSKAERSLTKIQGNRKLVTDKLKTGDITAAVNQIGNNLQKRADRLKKDINHGLTAAGIKKTKASTTK
ncbi:hypothetical protein [Mycolicibacterium insubricum]|uniref:hypothetical protein n=1 Tax=Mycolicibacterium insubricum TaxID=444597 RepID=UPI00105566AD|nr:hypothetical protein [Mycolicibacterium insubricum]MCV7082479.1 hypothetical protein [Mycolicibacterium insubricum]